MLRRERLHPIEREQELERQRLLGHSVPSLSKVAMRSGTGTKSGEPSFVTLATKSPIAFFVGPSFHDGSGSLAPEAACVAGGAEDCEVARLCGSLVHPDASVTASHKTGMKRFICGLLSRAWASVDADEVTEQHDRYDDVRLVIDPQTQLLVQDHAPLGQAALGDAPPPKGAPVEHR